jgi:hypothetical protein
LISDIDLTKVNSGLSVSRTLNITINRGGVINGIRLSSESRFCDGTTFGSSFAYSYAYSVFNDRSTSEALTEIGRALGRMTQEDSSIRVIQSPLLGTGAGWLSNDDAAKALIAGFVETCHPNALLCIFVSDSERHKDLQKHLKSALSQFLYGISIEVSFMGVSIKKALKDFLDDALK